MSLQCETLILIVILSRQETYELPIIHPKLRYKERTYPDEAFRHTTSILSTATLVPRQPNTIPNRALKCRQNSKERNGYYQKRTDSNPKGESKQKSRTASFRLPTPITSTNCATPRPPPPPPPTFSSSPICSPFNLTRTENGAAPAQETSHLSPEPPRSRRDDGGKERQWGRRRRSEGGGEAAAAARRAVAGLRGRRSGRDMAGQCGSFPSGFFRRKIRSLVRM